MHYEFDMSIFAHPTVKQVFVTPLMNADPPVLPAERLHSFVAEVFFNLESISAHHHRMLVRLFERQREQHPLVQSVADIILDCKPKRCSFMSPSDPTSFSCSALSCGLRILHQTLSARRSPTPIRTAQKQGLSCFYPEMRSEPSN
jgi:hypothetical protein